MLRLLSDKAAASLTPALPSAGLLVDEDELFYYRTGQFFGRQLCLKRHLRLYAADTQSRAADFKPVACTKHAYNTKKLTPGTYLVWCNKHRRCIGFFVMREKESARTAFEVIYTRWLCAQSVHI